MRLFPMLLLLASCAQVTSLNLRRHQFGMQPSRIVWFQVPGLDAEHLAMLRFSLPTAENRTELEGAVCAGHAWSYNLHHIRPDARASLFAQTTGKKDVQGNCQDWALRPIWNYLTPEGYKAGVLEASPEPGQSLTAAKACGATAEPYTSDVALWVMGQRPAGAEGEDFLPSVPAAYLPGKTYWDKTCGPRGCGSSLSSAAPALYATFSKNSKRHLYMVRDYSLASALKSRNLLAARESLRELDKAVGSFMRMADKSDDMLVLVSGAAAVDLEFPAEGKEWQQFDAQGKQAFPRNGELMSPVFAHGARAENFCGIYEESQVFERVLSGPKQQGLELRVINPFN